MATITWSGATNNSWLTPGNWDLARIPQTGDDVRATGSVACTVPASISGLSLSSFDLTGYTGTFTFTGVATLATTGKFWWPATANVIACSYSGGTNLWTINVGGDAGQVSTGTSADLSGFVFNLSGVGPARYGAFYSTVASGGTALSGLVGQVNILVGGNYFCTASGSNNMEFHLYGRLLLQDGTLNSIGSGFGQYLQGHNNPNATTATDDAYFHVGSTLDFDGTFNTSRWLHSYGSRIMLNAGTWNAPYVMYSLEDFAYLAPGTYGSGLTNSALWVCYGGSSQATALKLAAGSTYRFNFPSFLAYNQLGGSPPRAGWVIPGTTTVQVDASTISAFYCTDNAVISYWNQTGDGWCNFTNAGAFTPPLGNMGRARFSGGTPTVTPISNTTTLAGNGGSITSGATSVIVTSAAGLPVATGSFVWYAKIDSEIVKVTAISSNTLTIVRAQFGTTAASHNDGATLSVANPLLATSLLVDGTATFSAAGQPMQLRDGWLSNAGAFTASGFAGSYVAVTEGSVALLSPTGLNPNSAWTLALPTHSPDSKVGPKWVVKNATIKNLTVTGQTLTAVNCTDGGGNSGITFTAVDTGFNEVVARQVISPSAGNRLIEADYTASNALTAYLDGVAIFSATVSTFTGVGTHGVCCYYDGAGPYQQAASITRLQILSTAFAPFAPQSLAVTNAGVATWSGAVGATGGYLLQRRTPSGSGSYSTIATTNQSTWTATDASPPRTSTADYQVVAVGAGGNTASAAVTVNYAISDTFNGTNGTVLNGRALDSGALTWSVAARGATLPTWQCNGSSQAVQPTNTNNYNFCWYSFSTTSYTLQVTFTLPGSTHWNPGLVFRGDGLTTSSNWWMAMADDTNLELWLVSAGSLVPKGSVAASFVAGQTYTLKVVDNTSTGVITVFLNGVQKIQVTDLTLAANTYKGLLNYKDSTYGQPTYSAYSET